MSIVLLGSGLRTEQIEYAVPMVDNIVEVLSTDRCESVGMSDADFVVLFDTNTYYPKGACARLIKPMLDDSEVMMTSGRSSNFLSSLFQFFNYGVDKSVVAFRREECLIAGGIDVLRHWGKFVRIDKCVVEKP